MTRGELRQAVMDNLVRQDMSATLANSWIQAVTTRLNTMLRHRQMMKHKTLPVTTKTFLVPTDFIEARNVRINAQMGANTDPVGAVSGELLYQPPSEIAGMAAQLPYDQTMSPSYYTMHGLDMELAPWTGNGPYQIEMWYYGKLVLATTDDATNFFLTDYPHVYMNGVMAFGHRYYLEADQAAGYDQLFISEVGAINDSEMMAEAGRGPLIVRPSRRIGGRFS